MGKPKFSFEKHKITGAELFTTREALSVLHVEIANSYPLDSKVSKLAEKLVKTIDELRCELDSQLFKDCPQETKGDDWKRIYYPGTRQG